jgi:hypothetical protein
MLRRKEPAGRRDGIWPPHSPLGQNDESVKTAKKIDSSEDGRRSAKSDKWEPFTLTDATCEKCAPCFLNRINAKSGAVQALPCKFVIELFRRPYFVGLFTISHVL